ncbi:MAG: glycoside hydrolase family 57 protein [Candidatus Paceibacterota bacterium]
MTSVCFYFQVHQPFRLNPHSIFDIGSGKSYFGVSDGTDLDNQAIMNKVATKCYRPMTQLLLELLERHPQFRVSFSITGTALEQFRQFAPDVIELFRALAATGRVEFLNETYHHSLAFIHSPEEFTRQIRMHTEAMEEVFGVTPTVFRNTELIYNNDLAAIVSKLGFRGMLAEGADHILGWRSPNFVYHSRGDTALPLLLKNYKLSDDIAFRFGEKTWESYPLTAATFANWVNSNHGAGDVVNLFMDYETFGEHQWEDTGIFSFMRELPTELYRHPDTRFATPSDVLADHAPVGEIDAPQYVSWADVERDLSAWHSNEMQADALRSVFALESDVIASGDEQLIDDWRRLTTSDHFYYMCTKWFADGDVHTYFNPYQSPYDAFIAYMNVLHDVQLRIDEIKARRVNGEPVSLRKVT